MHQIYRINVCITLECKCRARKSQSSLDAICGVRGYGPVAVSMVPDVRAAMAQPDGLKPRHNHSRATLNRCQDAALQATYSLLFAGLSCTIDAPVPVRLAGDGGPGTAHGRAFFTIAGVLGDMEEVAALLGVKRAWSSSCMWCPRHNLHAGDESHQLADVRDAVLQWTAGNKQQAEALNYPVADTVCPTWRDPTRPGDHVLEVPRSPLLDQENFPVMGCFGGGRGRQPHLSFLPVDALHCWILGHIKRLYVAHEERKK